MKLSKKILLGIGTLSVVALASCTQSKTNIDDSSKNTSVAQNWFSLGRATSEGWSKVYTTKIYDPSVETEDFNKDSDYYTVYAPDDIDSAIRLTLTLVNEDNFTFDGRNSTSSVRYLQTVQYSSTYQNYFEEKISNSAETINNAITSLSANVQTTWTKSFADYEITSSSLVEDKSNYLAVYYLPLLYKQYASGSVTALSFFVVPVKVELIQAQAYFNEDGKLVAESSDNALADTFIDSGKYVTYSYDSSSDIIA